jgi:hypothetical protein
MFRLNDKAKTRLFRVAITIAAAPPVAALILKNGAGLGVTWPAVFAVLGWFTGWSLVAGVVALLKAAPDGPRPEELGRSEDASEAPMDLPLLPEDNCGSREKQP